MMREPHSKSVGPFPSRAVTVLLVALGFLLVVGCASHEGERSVAIRGHDLGVRVVDASDGKETKEEILLETVELPGGATILYAHDRERRYLPKTLILPSESTFAGDIALGMRTLEQDYEPETLVSAPALFPLSLAELQGWERVGRDDLAEYAEDHGIQTLLIVGDPRDPYLGESGDFVVHITQVAELAIVAPEGLQTQGQARLVSAGPMRPPLVIPAIVVGAAVVVGEICVAGEMHGGLCSKVAKATLSMVLDKTVFEALSYCGFFDRAELERTETFSTRVAVFFGEGVPPAVGEFRWPVLPDVQGLQEDDARARLAAAGYDRVETLWIEPEEWPGWFTDTPQGEVVSVEEENIYPTCFTVHLWVKGPRPESVVGAPGEPTSTPSLIPRQAEGDEGEGDPRPTPPQERLPKGAEECITVDGGHPTEATGTIILEIELRTFDDATGGGPPKGIYCASLCSLSPHVRLYVGRFSVDGRYISDDVVPFGRRVRLDQLPVGTEIELSCDPLYEVTPGQRLNCDPNTGTGDETTVVVNSNETVEVSFVFDCVQCPSDETDAFNECSTTWWNQRYPRYRH